MNSARDISATKYVFSVEGLRCKSLPHVSISKSPIREFPIVVPSPFEPGPLRICPHQQTPFFPLEKEGSIVFATANLLIWPSINPFSLLICICACFVQPLCTHIPRPAYMNAPYINQLESYTELRSPLSSPSLLSLPRRASLSRGWRTARERAPAACICNRLPFLFIFFCAPAQSFSPPNHHVAKESRSLSFIKSSFSYWHSIADISRIRSLPTIETVARDTSLINSPTTRLSTL